MIGLLKELHVVIFRVTIMFGMLPRDVPPNSVIPGECPRAVRTRHPDALVTLPYVSAQIRLVAVQSLTVGTLQFFACRNRNIRLQISTDDFTVNAIKYSSLKANDIYEESNFVTAKELLLLLFYVKSLKKLLI